MISTNESSEFFPNDMALVALRGEQRASMQEAKFLEADRMVLLDRANAAGDQRGPFLYTLFGYPASNRQAKLDRPRKNFKQYSMMFITAADTAFDFAKAGLNADVHLALHFDPSEEILDSEGNRITVPHLKGTSGGAIFRVSRGPLKLAGILIEWRRPSRTVLAIRISAFDSLAKEIDLWAT